MLEDGNYTQPDKFNIHPKVMNKTFYSGEVAKHPQHLELESIRCNLHYREWDSAVSCQVHLAFSW